MRVKRERIITMTFKWNALERLTNVKLVNNKRLGKIINSTVFCS